MREVNGVLLNDGEYDEALWTEVDGDAAEYVRRMREDGRVGMPHQRASVGPMRVEKGETRLPC